MLLVAAQQTGLLSTLLAAFMQLADPTIPGLRPPNPAVIERLVLTLLFLPVAGLARTWDLRSYTGTLLAVVTGRERAYSQRYTERFLVRLAERFRSRVPREPVEESRRFLKMSLKRLGTSQNVQVVDHGAATQIEEILALPPVAGTSALPPSYTSQGMFDRSPFAQFGPVMATWHILSKIPRVAQRDFNSSIMCSIDCFFRCPGSTSASSFDRQVFSRERGAGGNSALLGLKRCPGGSAHAAER